VLSWNIYNYFRGFGKNKRMSKSTAHIEISLFERNEPAMLSSGIKAVYYVM